MSFLTLLVAAALAGPYDTLFATKASSAADEYRMGQEYVEGRRWLLGVWDEPDQQVRVERIVRRILAKSDRPDQVYTVVLLQDKVLNAAALPGGFLLVNRGLLEAMNDDELAFILGHELSHVMLRHAANRLNVQAASTSVAELQRALGSQDKSVAALKSDELYLMMMGHSRQLELEADLYGLLYSVRAGYPAGAAIAAMTRLQASVPTRTGVYAKAYSTHPEFSERLEQLAKGTQGLRTSAAGFDAGLRWMAVGRPDKAAAQFQSFLTMFPQSKAGWANLAVAEMLQDPGQKSDPYEELLPLHTDSGVAVRDASTVRRDRARDALAHAFKLDEHDPITLGLLGALARRDGALPEARRYLEEAVAIAPWVPALHLSLGNVAAAEGKMPEAIRSWEQALKLSPELAEVRVNLGREYTAKKQKKKALEVWEPLVGNARWGAEAEASIATFEKRKPVKVAPPGATEGLVLAGKMVRVGDPVSVLAGLGAADVDFADEGGRYQLWDAVGVAALSDRDRVVSLELSEPTTLKTSSGWSLPCAPAPILAALGPATESRTSGPYVTRRWAGAGVTAIEEDGQVVSLSFEKPAAQ